MATIGNMNVPVEFQSLAVTDDGAGGTTGVWTKQFDFMASVEPLKGFRVFEYSQIIKGNGYVIRTLFRTDLNNAGRLKLYDGTIINIHSLVNVAMKNQHIEIIGSDGR